MCPRNRFSFGESSQSNSYGGSQRNQAISDDYWNDLFANTDYYGLYQSIMDSYNVAPPNTFWGFLTGQNKTNAYQHEMQKRDELSALAEKMYNEQYASFANQASLQRQAGLNPDINGVDGGFTSDLAPDAPNPSISAQNPLDVVQGAAGVLLNAFSLGKGIAEGFLSFKSMRLDNYAKKMALAGDLAGFITPQSAYGFEDGASSQYQQIDMLTSSLFRKRDARMMSHYLKQIVENPYFKSGYYGNLKSYSRDRQDYFINTSGDHWSEDDKVMDILSKGLSDVVNLALKSSANRTVSDNQEAVEFNDIFDSSLSATSENSENELQSYKKDIANTMLSMVSDLNKSDSPLAKGITIALQVLLAKYIGM